MYFIFLFSFHHPPSTIHPLRLHPSHRTRSYSPSTQITPPKRKIIADALAATDAARRIKSHAGGNAQRSTSTNVREDLDGILAEGSEATHQYPLETAGFIC